MLDLQEIRGFGGGDEEFTRPHKKANSLEATSDCNTRDISASIERPASERVDPKCLKPRENLLHLVDLPLLRRDDVLAQLLNLRVGNLRLPTHQDCARVMRNHRAKELNITYRALLTHEDEGRRRTAVVEDGRTAFVTNTYANTVSVIDLASMTVVATYQTGKAPNGVATK